MRLQLVLMEVISPDQSTFLSMRFILNTVFLTSETIHYAKQSRQPLPFLKLDFSKAYDKVDLTFFYHALEHMGFLASFTYMTRILKIPKCYGEGQHQWLSYGSVPHSSRCQARVPSSPIFVLNHW